MPNWKSYESSVRLLSAILAAHPELRLNYQEIAKSFGADMTGSAIEFRFRRVKVDAKAVREARASGIDPLTLEMDGGLCKPTKEISKRYGGDCTVSALENRFRRVKSDAKALNDALANGIDPITISTDSLGVKNGKEIAMYFGNCTASSLDHRLRPIKKEAQAMREGIADKYGEDVTAKAVSTRFERMKKESAWLTNNPTGSNGTNNGGGMGGGKPKPVTPRKKKPVSGATASTNSDDDERFDEPKSTTKKATLNKTQGGRVTKPQTPRKNGSFSVGPSAAITVDSDDENDFDELVKPDLTCDQFHNGYGNGNSMQIDDDNDHGVQYYEAAGYGSEGDEV